MEHECSIVRDLLPLYLEHMVSDETAAFVRNHLDGCPSCANEFSSLQVETGMECTGTESPRDLDAEIEQSLKAIAKKFRHKAYRVAGVIIAIALAVSVLLHFFPVYRIADVSFQTYSASQVGMALAIGSASDRREAQAVLRLADQAFADTRHTSVENEATYGLLARYATSTDAYNDAAFNTHSLELWSAHLGENDGWIWVYYSSETFDHDGNTIRGSWRIPSLWRVEKNAIGEWVVVQIVEHA
jgi:hypothetical protein